MPMETMTDWFGLKDGHTDFKIQPEDDPQLSFTHKEMDKKLEALLNRSFRTSTPPKCVLYGDWGTGKTHTMRHLEYVIGDNPDYRARVVFVELPDIESKSKFNVAHAAFLDAIGIETAKKWLQDFLLPQGEQDGRAEIKRISQSEDIAVAFGNLAAYGENSRIAWDWLRGEKLSRQESLAAGLSTGLDQSTQLVRVLILLGKLCRLSEENCLVFFLDEVAKLNQVINNDSIKHWTNAFKIIADPQTKDIGIIISISALDAEELVFPLLDDQVMSRFGEGNYLQLQRLDPTESGDFLKRLLVEWVDSDKRKNLLSEFDAEREGEKVDSKSFPFTVDGLEVFIEYTSRNGGVTRPRDVQDDLNVFLNTAIDSDRHILSSSYVSSKING